MAIKVLIDDFSDLDIEPKIRQIIREEIALALAHQPTSRPRTGQLTVDESKIKVVHPPPAEPPDPDHG